MGWRINHPGKLPSRAAVQKGFLNCGAIHRDTVSVHEVFKGETVWRGDVEVFDLTGHPKAKRCYGWSYGESEEFITILELPRWTQHKAPWKLGSRIRSRRPENSVSAYSIQAGRGEVQTAG